MILQKIKDILQSKWTWAGIIVLLGWTLYTNYKSVKVHVAETGVSDSVVAGMLKEDGIANKDNLASQIVKKIDTIKDKNPDPFINLPPTATKKEIQAAIDSDKGDLVIKEENVNTRPGTNIYSIHLDKSKHGIGIYGSVRYDAGQVDGGYGLHYRNKRWVYQAGVAPGGGFEGRVAYEVAQW